MKAYDGKRREFEEYLDQAWSHEQHNRFVMNEHKVYRFVFYQVAREKRLYRRGQRDRREEQYFDKADYDNIMAMYDFNSVNDTVSFIQPQNGLKFQALRQYKAVIKEFCNDLPSSVRPIWETVWTHQCNALMNIVRSRGPQQRLKNFEEKVTHSLSPFTIVHRYPEIEDKLFHQGMGNMRMAVTQMRNRYVLTHTTSGILRFESLEKARLSDFLCIFIKKEEDVHPLLIMVTQVFTGKC